jgi:hypothetical protein
VYKRQKLPLLQRTGKFERKVIDIWESNRKGDDEMGFMLAEKQNYEICEAIIEMFHKKEISVEQSYAILDYVKRKIAQDTKVGELVKISYEDFL